MMMRALEALKNNQRQLDIDGVEVAVSRQALDELIAAYEALTEPRALDEPRAEWSFKYLKHTVKQIRRWWAS